MASILHSGVWTGVELVERLRPFLRFSFLTDEGRVFDVPAAIPGTSDDPKRTAWATRALAQFLAAVGEHALGGYACYFFYGPTTEYPVKPPEEILAVMRRCVVGRESFLVEEARGDGGPPPLLPMPLTWQPPAGVMRALPLASEIREQACEDLGEPLLDLVTLLPLDPCADAGDTHCAIPLPGYDGKASPHTGRVQTAAPNPHYFDPHQDRAAARARGDLGEPGLPGLFDTPEAQAALRDVELRAWMAGREASLSDEQRGVLAELRGHRYGRDVEKTRLLYACERVMGDAYAQLALLPMDPEQRAAVDALGAVHARLGAFLVAPGDTSKGK